MRVHGTTSRSRGYASALLWCSIVIGLGGAAGDALAADPSQPPDELWQQFPLNGQGTTPAPAQTEPATTPTPTVATTVGAFRPPSKRPSTVTPPDASSVPWTWIVLGLAAVIALAAAGGDWAWRRHRGVERSRARSRHTSSAARALQTPHYRWVRLKRIPARWREGRRRPLPQRPALAYAAGHRRLPSLAAFFDAGGDERGGGFRLGGLLRGRRKPDTAERPEPDEVDTSEESVPHRPVDLIDKYSAAPSTTPDAEDTPPGSAQSPASEAPALQPADEPPEHGRPVIDMVDEHIAAAREAHFAVALVAVRVAQPAGERPDQEELRERLGAALPHVLGSAEQPELIMDADEQLIWLAVPGVLPRRAAEVVTRLRELLNEGGLAPIALAVGGYPRDGSTADELVEHCRAALDRDGLSGPRLGTDSFR
jgi:hypothetical protein